MRRLIFSFPKSAWCLDWNQPSIDFYLSLGAEPMKDWTVYRLAGERLAASFARQMADADAKA